VGAGSITRTVFRLVRSVRSGVRPAVTECDGEGVDHRLPTHRPSCPPGPGRVQAAGHKIQALQRGLLGRKMTSGPYRPSVAGIQRLDGVRRADHLPDLEVVIEERNELGPGVPPQPDHAAIFLPPFLVEFVERQARPASRRETRHRRHRRHPLPDPARRRGTRHPTPQRHHTDHPTTRPRQRRPPRLTSSMSR
jgi:hypothetical protein